MLPGLFFTKADDSKVYAYTGNNALAFERNIVANIGEFSMDNTPYEPRGEKVGADQEVDMGLIVTIGSTNYKVIFAKSNLTATGLAVNDYDYGDYFAWGATEPWYSSIDTSTSPWTISWKDGKSGGYITENCPSYNNDSYVENDVLKMEYDAAHQILGGDWQLPTQKIWGTLCNTTNYTWTWETQDGNQGYQVTNKSDNSKSLFLPAAGCLYQIDTNEVGSIGFYWSSTSYLNTLYSLYLDSGSVDPGFYGSHGFGFSVRPVRLVAVE